MLSRTARGSSLVAPFVAAFILLLGLTACSSAAPAGPTLPPAPELLNKAATAMSAIKTTAVDIQVDPTLTSIPIRSANGKLTSTGDAIGTATLDQGSGTYDFQFVITGGRLFLKGPTGHYQQLPLALAASIYDPTALLSPDRGLPALVRSANNAVTEAEEDVNGAPAYRIRASLDPTLVSSVLPGLSGTSSGKVWIDKATSRLVRAQLDVPTAPSDPAPTSSAAAPGGPTAPVTVTMSDFDAPVTITPPA
ncbi:LppX_LprAFG lipoprotein [Pseudonocardia spinosispora]|uniref:LppX_LprAFG lipoprotein n=1 Tax=Pseudonocardia spinosispora TaxID=103441 RepID=UPI00048E1B80|nr:LppX_LprAFG lipoprotein [Pseudonocardia spinosispora]